MRWFIAVLFATTALSAADLKVMAIGAINPGFRNIADRFERDTGNKITLLADTAPGLTRRLAAGENADLLIAPDNVIDEATKLGKVITGTRTPVAKVGIGVAVRQGATSRAIPDLDSLKQALLEADAVVYNQGSSGLYIDKLFEQMGLTAAVKAKTIRYPNAAQVVNHVMGGKGNEVAFAPLPEIMSSDPKKLHSLGPLPTDVQNYTRYTGAVMNGPSAEPAKDFLRYLTSKTSREVFAAAGVD